MKVEWRGFVNEGKLEITDIEGFRSALSMLSGEVEIVVGRIGKKRSNQQNAWYWGICIEMVREALSEQGHDFTPAEVHEAMKWKFLQRHEEGIELPTVRSTTTLSTTEFSEYKEKIQRWGAEYLHINIPDPQEHL